MSPRERESATTYDVLGIGCAAVDDLLYVGSYPPPDAKMPILRRERQCGGLTATALVAASRLGSKCAYGGTLGDDELSRFVLDRLQQESVDTMHAVRRPGARPFHSTIIVDEARHTRNIFFEADGVIGADPEAPPAEVICSARVLFVDHVGVGGMIRGADIAREAGIPVVADLERDESPHFAELLARVDHLIVSRDFAAKITGEADPVAVTAALWPAGRGVVVVTFGADGCWYYAGPAGGPPRHQPAFPVKVADTTGCGDVFHGAYASALARGVELPERVRFAAAAAALKATRSGGQAGIPTRPAVEAFLQECQE
jgi:sulfofructose kinase